MTTNDMFYLFQAERTSTDCAVLCNWIGRRSLAPASAGPQLGRVCRTWPCPTTSSPLSLSLPSSSSVEFALPLHGVIWAS